MKLSIGPQSNHDKSNNQTGEPKSFEDYLEQIFLAIPYHSIAWIEFNVKLFTRLLEITCHLCSHVCVNMSQLISTTPLQQLAIKKKEKIGISVVLLFDFQVFFSNLGWIDSKFVQKGLWIFEKLQDAGNHQFKEKEIVKSFIQHFRENFVLKQILDTIDRFFFLILLF